MAIRRWATAFLAVVMLLSACAGGITSPAGRLDAAINEALKAAKIPGALIGIWSPEFDYVKSFGPWQTDFYSRIGSVTKTFTATAVSQLADQGKIGLDDPIAKYLEGVPNGQNITVRQLAAMRSGLADYTKVDGFEQAVTADPRRNFPPAELLAWAFQRPAEFLPDAKFEYSNTNYILLGLLVERVGGVPFGDYLTTRVLAPVGLTHTSFPTATQFPEPHARGYTDPDGDGPPVDSTDWNASLTWTAGAMISTLQDMRTWVPALATGPLSTTVPPSGPGEFHYGMGIFTVSGWIGHNGSVPGYQTVAMYLPERAMTLVVMINTDIAVPGGGDPSEALATAITSVITPDHVYKLGSP